MTDLRTRFMAVSVRDIDPLITAVLMVAPVVAAAIFYVWTNVAAVRLGYELTAAARTHRSLLEENRGLRIDVATLRSPARLERLAKNRYHLHPPVAGQIIRLPR